MLIARFLYRSVIRYGVLDGEFFDLLSEDLNNGIKPAGGRVKREEVTLLAPVAPRLIIGLGRNYYSHIQEMGVEPPDRPAVFFKPASSIIGHLEPVIIPRWATRVDYEGELGVVIGRPMKYVQERDVADHILGCVCFNDVTERHVGSSGLINQDISKCCDTFGPCGPWISTDVDPDNAALRTFLNGRLVQQDNTNNTVFKTARVLSELSSFMALMPGDLVITGTPGGIGPVQPGDRVDVKIDGIGCLSSSILAEE